MYIDSVPQTCSARSLASGALHTWTVDRHHRHHHHHLSRFSLFRWCGPRPTRSDAASGTATPFVTSSLAPGTLLSATTPLRESVQLRQSHIITLPSSLSGTFLPTLPEWVRGWLSGYRELRTRDRKFAGSNPCGSGGRIFFSRVNFLC